MATENGTYAAAPSGWGEPTQRTDVDLYGIGSIEVRRNGEGSAISYVELKTGDTQVHLTAFDTTGARNIIEALRTACDGWEMLVEQIEAEQAAPEAKSVAPVGV